jgi:hypothetical protein
MSKKRKMILIIGGILIICICVFTIIIITKSNSNTNNTGNNANTGTVTNTNSITNSNCPQDYDTDMTKWVEYDAGVDARFSLKIPKTFTAKATNATNFNITGNGKTACMHNIHIDFNDYPVGSKCTEVLTSYSNIPNLNGSVTMKQGSMISGIASCELDYEINEGSYISYRKFVSIYKGTRYYVILVTANNKSDIAVYENILGTIILK